MKEYFTIGVITKPHGVRGELKVTLFSGSPTRFTKIKKVIIDKKIYSVLGSKPCGDFVALSILGVNDRNIAETFRGKYVDIKREDATELNNGEYYVEDIVGCSLNDEKGEVLGEIIEVTSAKTDIFVVKCIDGKIMRFPFLKDLIFNIDVEKNSVSVKRSRLDEVSCYED